MGKHYLSKTNCRLLSEEGLLHQLKRGPQVYVVDMTSVLTQSNKKQGIVMHSELSSFCPRHYIYYDDMVNFVNVGNRLMVMVMRAGKTQVAGCSILYTNTIICIIIIL